MRLDAGEAVGDGLLLSLLERERVVQRACDEVGECAKEQDFFLGKIHGRGGLDVQDAVKLFRVKNRESDGGDGIRQERLQSAIRGRIGTEKSHLPVARDVTDEARAERNALAKSAATRARFGLDHDFARGVIQRADADVVVGESSFQLLGDFREHLVGIQRGDGVARNGIEQRQVARFGALFVEETSVFDGDAGFAGEHAEQLEMALIKSALVVGENGHGADGVVISHKGNAAKTASLANGFDAELSDFIDIIFANQNRLARSNDVFGEMVSGRANTAGHAIAADDFQLKAKFVVDGIELGDIEVFDIEEAAQLFPDFFAEFFSMQSGTEDAPDFVEHVQFFGAARSLLNQVAVLNGHSDLVAERKQKAQFGGSKASIIRGAEQENPKGLLLGLKADGHHTAQSLSQSQFAEAADGFFLVEGGERVVAKVAESQQATEARHQTDKIVVQAFVLCDAAKFIGQTNGDDRGWSLRITVVEEQRAGGEAHDTEDTVQSL